MSASGEIDKYVCKRYRLARFEAVFIINKPVSFKYTKLGMYRRRLFWSDYKYEYRLVGYLLPLVMN